MEPNVVAKEKRQTEYFVKNERTNVRTAAIKQPIRQEEATKLKPYRVLVDETQNK